VTVTEGNSGTTNAVFTVTLSAASASTVTVNYATANGTATAGSDYVAQNNTLTFTAGQTSRTITVVVTGDTTVEPNETFLVNLSNPVGATIADAQGQGTITNDDPPPALSIDSVTVNEAAGTASFTVSLTAVSDLPVTVDYATTDVSATAGADYAATPTTQLVIPAGAPSGTNVALKAIPRLEVTDVISPPTA